jgi:hypothetical protein
MDGRDFPFEDYGRDSWDWPDQLKGQEMAAFRNSLRSYLLAATSTGLLTKDEVAANTESILRELGYQARVQARLVNTPPTDSYR